MEQNDNISKFYKAFNEKYDNFATEDDFRAFLSSADDSKIENLYKAFNAKYDNFGDVSQMKEYLGVGESKNNSTQQPQQSQQSAPVANGGQYVAQDAGVAHYPIDPAKMRAAGAKPAAAVRTAGQSLGEAQKAKSEAMKAAKSGEANAVSDFSRSMDANIKALNAQHEQNSKSIELAKKRAMTMSGNDRSVATNPVTGKFENGFVTRSGNVVFSKAEQDIADKGIRESMRPDEALNNIFDAYDGGASTEAAWSEAESLTASEVDAAAIEASKNPSMFMTGTAAGAAASASLMQKGMVVIMTYHDLQRMADRSWEMLGLEKRSKICESVYSMLKRQNPGANETDLWENAKRIARAENDKKMFELAVKKNAPKDATDAFMKNAIEQNTLYTILKGSARKVAGTTGDMEARDVAMNNYFKDHLGLRVGSTVAGFMTDPLTYASGGFGGFAAKGSMWLGGKVATKFATKAVSKAGGKKIAQTLAGRVASGVVGGSGNLAVYESGKEAANQYQWGGKLSVDDNGRYVVSDYSFDEIGKSLGHGALMGAGIGWVGPVFGNVSTNAVNAIDNTAMKGVVRASELGVTVLAEGTIFAAPDMYKAVHDYNVIIDSLSNPNSQYYIEDEDERAKRIAEIVEERGDAVLDVWTDSMATMAGFKIQGMLKSAPRRIMELSEDPNTKAGFETRLRRVLDGQSDEYRLTKDEQSELENGGYSDLRKLVDGYLKSGEDVRKSGVSPSTKLIGDGGESELPYNRFIDLMQDKNISQAARAKMYYYITGNMLPMSTVMDSGVIEHKDGNGNVVGYTVRSLGANDAVITSRTFESKKDAEREERRIFRQAELNGINMGEVYTDTFADKKRMFDACKAVGEQNGMAAEPLYRIMQMDADKMSEVERKLAGSILETYEGLGDKYSSESIRKDINKAYGVDVDKVIAMEPGRRSDVEKEALKDYARRLYKDTVEEANRGAEDVSNGENPVDESEPPVIGTDRENASFRRGYNANDEESKDIYSEYKNNPEDASAEAAWNGVLKRINDDVDTEVAKSREELKGVANDDGIVYEVSLKEVDAEGKPKKAYIKSGNVVMSADGNGVDKTQSDSTVVIINPETGKKEMIDPASEIGVASIDSMAPMEAVVAEYRKDLEEKSASLINELMGVVIVNPGDGIVLPDGRPANVVAVDGDEVVAVFEDGSQVSTTVTALQEYADMVSDASYRDRHDVVPPSNDEAANVPATSAPERVEDPLKNIPGRVEGAPGDYTAGTVLVVRDKDGNTNTAVCQGRFRISADGKSKEPDTNGRFIGYVEKGKDEVTIKTKEAMDDITEAWVEERREDNAEPVDEAAMPTADAGLAGAETAGVETGEEKSAEVEPERKAEPEMSESEAVYEEVKNKYGDKVGHKLDVTVADKKAELNKKAKAMAKAMAEYDDAPIGKEDAAEKKLAKAQAEYDASNAEYDRWASVKAVHDAKAEEDEQVRDRSLKKTGDRELVEGARTVSGRGEVEASKAYEGNVGPADIRQYEDKANVGPRDIRQYGEGASVGPRDIRAYEEPIGPMPLDEEQKNSVDNLERLKEEDYTTYLSTLENMSDEDLLSIIAALGPNSNNASLVEPYEYYDARHRDEYNSAYDMTFNSINSVEDAEDVSSMAIARYKESDYCSQDRCDVIGQIDAAYDKANELKSDEPAADEAGAVAYERNIEADKKEVENIISDFRDLFERDSNGMLSNMMMQDVSINGTGTIAMAKSTAKYMSDEELADYIEKYNKLYDDVRNAGIDNAEEYLANNFESSIDIFVGKKHVPIIDILKDEAVKREAKRSKDSGSKFTEREIGNAVAEQLNSIGVEVHADVMEYQHEYQSAKADKSEAGKPQFFTDKDGNRYGFARYGKIYIDPRQIDAEKAIHEYAHLWSKALEFNNPEGWQSVVDMLKGSEPVWKGIAEEMQDATDGEIASEIISRYSGKKGGELLNAEIEKLSSDGDMKSVLGNALQNIKKAIQDFWKMIGDFLHINYSTPEQVYDQVVKDFASGVNPRIYIEKAIAAKDAEYAKAVKSGNEERAKEIFNGVLKETIGNGAVPYMSVANYRSVQSLAHKVKAGDAAAIKEAADMMAPLVPSNAVLVPMVGHTGVATDMMQLANVIAENTGRPVVDALESDPRESQYESKKGGVVLSADELGVRMKSGVEIPDGMMPVVIDNVVGTGNTAMAAVNALGKGIVLSLGSAAGNFKRVAELKSANVIDRDAEGNLIPLSERFNILQGANIKKQKAEGVSNVSESDKAAGEMFDELMMSAGIPMEFDDEAQRVLDMKIAETKKMKAWHGSSAIFDAFDSSHFFEGEGSMVYGAGHYVTNVEETGRMYANIAANTNGIKKNLRTPNDVESERSFIENKIKEANEWGVQAQVEYWQNELDNVKDSDIDRQLYEVDIPDDNGSNYIDWNTNDPNVLKDIASKTPYYDIIKYGIDRSIIKDFSELYRYISRRSGSNTAASKILNDAGFSGIKVPTGNRNGGDGRGMNYVIFNDKDLRIVNRISFHKVDDYPVYFSNAYRAVEGIKQEKATPEQWLAMLQKNGGLKAGEDKWIGLSDWLKERSADAKRTGANTITKDEVLQYIADNKIEIEEVEYGDSTNVDAFQKWDRVKGRKGYVNSVDDKMFIEDFTNTAYYDGEEIGTFDNFDEAEDALIRYSGRSKNKNINDTRLRYTTEGLDNKREIALVVPTIEPYNQGDEIHFGDAGDGRAVAWVRFGDVNIDESIIQLNEFEKKMEDKYGVKGRSLRHVVNEEEKAEIDRLMKLPSNVTSKVLIIDEIQSKRHQDGRENGYKTPIEEIKRKVKSAHEKLTEYGDMLYDKYGLNIIRDTKPEESAEQDRLREEWNNLQEEYDNAIRSKNVPDAPFDKNWHELAMKRMLRYAAENGYDKVAWTTGAQQAERYNISSVVDKIFISKVTVDDMTGKPVDGNVYDVFVHDKRGDVITEASGRMDAESVDKTFGKDLSNRLINGAEENVGSEFEVSGDGLTIGGEGMKGFYDRMLPQFMDKYGKKWGVKTGTVTLDLPNEADRVMHSVDVTPEMKESVMEGQPMFFKTEDGEVYGFTMDGKIYIDRRVAGSETRIHEYSHMWCEALRKANPKAWEQLKKLMKNEKDVLDYVKRKYPELTNDDELMDEVFAQYSGKRGAERLNEEMIAEMDKAEGVFEKAKIRKIFGKIKAMLDIFWDLARDLFSGNVKGISKMSADDFADMAFNDLLNGFNPMKNDGVPARLRDDMMGVHNISEEKLRKALKLGGLANPSMAVVDTRKGYKLGYGDITLIPRFTIIEKQRGRNAGTWTADAWTPTYPTVTSMPGKGTEKAYKSILNDWYAAEPIKEMRDVLERRLRYFTYAEDGNSEPRLAYQFLKERGDTPDVQYRKNDTDKDFYSFLVELSEETNIPINELAYSNEYDRVEQYLIDSTIKKERERISGRLNRALEPNEEKFVIDQANSRWKDQRGKIDNYIYTTNKYANRPDVEVDAEKTLSEAEFIVNRDSRIRKDYERWVDELRDRLGMEDKVFAGYTPSGNRKFVSNTLENVSRLMNRGGLAGGFGWTGPGTFIAKVSKKVNTLEAIKKNKGKIIGIDSSMLHNEAKDHINSEFFDLSQVLNQGYGRFEGVGENRLIELADVKGNVKSYLKREYDVDVDDEWIERYYKLVDFIQNKYPVFYFETKFNRPVEFWEFDSAVVPEGTSDEVIEGLKGHGVNVVEYDRTKDGEQERVTMDVANDRYGIKFQKGKTKAQKEVNNITEQENGVLYHTAMTIQSNFMKENGNLPLEMGVFTDDHFVIVNNVSVGNISAVRAFKIEESKDEIKKELQAIVRNEGNEISDSTRRTIEEARSKYGIVVDNTGNIGYGGNGMQDADMGGRQQSKRGADNALDSGEYISYGLSRIEELDKEYLEAVENGDIKKAQQMVNDSDAGFYNSSSSYQGSLAFNGAAPSSNAYFETKEERKEAFDNEEFEGDMSLGDYIDNGIDNWDLEWKLNNPIPASARDKATLESIRNISNAVKRGDGKIKMYRAVRDDIEESTFRNGDWITPSKEYAQRHIELQDWEGGRIIEQEVSVDDIWWDGNDINEWVYDDGKNYAYRNTKNNKKLLDAITYDDEGNVIPLSKRFDIDNPDIRYRTSEELDESNPGWREQKTTSGGHSTQIKGTLSTYKKIGEFLRGEVENTTILDASSGFGHGTKALRDMGFDVEDVEPYPSDNREEAPTYTAYADIDKKYDVVISNAVLNVIPDDWREDVLKAMADKTNVGGRMIINVRGDKEIASQGVEGVTKETLDTPSEILVKNADGSYRAYQKGFSKRELKEYVERVLGEGWEVEIGNEKNSGLSNGTVVVAKRLNGKPLKYRDGDYTRYPSYETRLKRARRSGYSKSQYDALLEREWDNMVNTANDLVEKLGMKDKVTLVERRDSLKGKKRTAKGWFDAKTGKVTIVLQNNTGADDVMKTIFHECVAHYGLRKMFGEYFDDFLVNVYNNCTPEVRGDILGIMFDKKIGLNEATEEYIAKVAEEDDYTRMNIFWDRIKTLFFEMLNKLGEAGMKIKNLIGKNEIRYILWRSYENLVEPGRYNPIVIAKDVVMRDKCGMPQYEYDDDKMYMVSDNNDDTDPDGDGPRGGVPSSKDQTKSENFKRWFGDWENDPENASKVVDEEGKPKVMYHGSDVKAKDINIFRMNDGSMGKGAYFTSNYEEACNYAKERLAGKYGFSEDIDEISDEDVEEYVGSYYLNVRDKDKIIHSRFNNKDIEVFVSYPNQIKSTENYGTFGEEESDIRFRDGDEELGNIWNDGSMGLQERVTASKVRIAEALKEDKEARDEALNAIVDDLHSLRKAVSIQKVYDKTTVKRVADLARVLVQTGYMNVDEMGRGDIKRLLSAVKNSTGRNDVSESVERVMDIMIESQLKHAESDLDKLLKIKGEKVDAKGVQVQGRVDVKGQEILKAFKSAQDWDIEKIDEAMASRLEEMESDDKAIKEHARNEYIGLSLAMDYLVSIKDSKYEESELKTALGKAGRSTDADREYIQSLKDALMENRIERINDYHEILRNLSVEISEGIERAKSFKNDEIEHKQEIYHNANSDLAGKPNNEHMPKDKHALLNAAADSVLLPLGTFEQMFKLFGSKSANGEGYLYNRFMRGYIDASDKEWRGYTSKIKTLDDKVSEIFNGKVKTLADLITGMRKMPKMYVAFNDGSQISTKELNQGAMLYLYMVNKMADGRMKLRKMGITRDMIEDVKNHLEPKLIELADWIQDEFLVDTRNEYNETHKRLFGAPMAAVEHYFPLKINPNSRVKSEDEINRGDADFNNTITSKTGSIIKRTKNSYALDILNANALEIIADHVAQMEHWNAFAELNRDLNTLLGYKNFSNKLKNMKTVYGAGEELYNRFRDLCQVAVGAYRPKTSHMDSAVTSISKGVSAANVSLRLHTALKQLLSIPAFVPDTRVDQFVKNLANPYSAVKWSMENLPMVNKRWSSRMSGDPRLMKTEADWKYWRSNVMQQASKFGMTPNAFVDLVAVSVGAKAVYDTRLAAYKKEGYSAEEADKRAKQDAEIVYNLSQQSSEGAFLSTMQKDRTMASVMFTLYRNAAMAYTRQGFTAMRSILNSLKDKEGMIEFMKKQYERDGMSEAQAEKNAKKKFWRENGKNLTRAAVFGYVLQYLWNLGGSAMYLLLGSDDKEKEKMLEEVKVKSRLGFVEGLTGGDVMSESYKMAVLDQFNADYAKKELPVVSDTYKTLEKFNNGYTGEGLNDLINVVVSTGVGINPRTVEDAVSAIVDACEGDVDLANEAAIFAMKVISAPQGAIERLYFDEIGLSVEEGSKMTPQELIERYATYKTRRDNFNSLDWDNEKSKEKNAKRGTKDVKERVERYTEPEAGETFADFSDKIKEWHKESEAARKSGDAGFGAKYDEREGYGMNATYQLLWNKNFNAVGKLEEMEKAYLNAKTPEDADDIFSAIKKYKAGIHDVVKYNGDYEKQKRLYGETVKVYVDFLISHPELRKK